ncbi:MAG: hypothetical protein WC108_07130 [Bacteroidales bacterium]|jgi:hypothetical protein
MKKIIISTAIALILLTASPAYAIGFRDYEEIITRIEILENKNTICDTSALELRIQNLESQNAELKSKVGILESLFNQLRVLLLQVIQMLVSIK